MRVSPWRRSASRACSSAVVNRSSGRGSGRIDRPASRSRACAKIHGLPNEPRAIMAPAHRVCARMATTSAAVAMSPLPMTGMSRTSTTRAISSQFAFPANIWVRVRACSVRARAPASRQRCAMVTGSRWLSSQPLRIFTVTGRCVALCTARMIRCTKPKSFRHPDPPLFFTTFFTGQPKLMSMKSGLQASVTISAARAMTVASAPYSWIPTGRSASSNRMSWNRCSKPRATPTAEINSDTTTSAPNRRAMSRNGDSDTPAMGARKRGNSCPTGYGKSMSHNVMTRCAGSNQPLGFAAVSTGANRRALA